MSFRLFEVQMSNMFVSQYVRHILCKPSVICRGCSLKILGRYFLLSTTVIPAVDVVHSSFTPYLQLRLYNYVYQVFFHFLLFTSSSSFLTFFFLHFFAFSSSFFHFSLLAFSSSIFFHFFAFSSYFFTFFPFHLHINFHFVTFSPFFFNFNFFVFSSNLFYFFAPVTFGCNIF